MRSGRWFLVPGFLVWLVVSPAAGQEIPAPVAEHHLHIRSGALATVDAESSGATTAADALAALDAASIERAIVLSVAFRFGASDVVVEDEYGLVRAENDYVAEQVATAPDRLLGACSVNPLADYALEEIERCAADSRLAALKLHLTNSEVDLRDAGHLERMAEVFRLLERLRLPVVAHIRTGADDYGARDAAALIDEVLSQAPTLPIQIAHMGGWGGYDEATDAALGAFVEALRDGRLDPDLISFGLGAVVFQPEAAGDDQELEQKIRRANEQLAERIRQIGLERVVFATDWPSWPPVKESRDKILLNARLIQGALPLEPEEMRQVFANCGSVLCRGSG